MPEAGSQGGPAACEPPFLDELRRQGHEVVEEVYVFAEASSSTPARIRRVLETARRFQERIREGSFAVVHLNTSFDPKALLRDAVIVPRLKSQGAKIFLKLHGSEARLLTTNNPMWRKLWRRLLAHCDGIGVLSSEERVNFLDAGISEQKVFLVKNVVENSTAERSGEFLRRWELPDDRPLILFIGRFIQAKGLLDVIAACGLLRDRGQLFRLLCVGDGPARRDAESAVKRLELAEQVRFFGYLAEEQAAGFYANSTVMVFPTYHYEGFPMVIFKAVAAGLPIITTRIRAAADYLQEPDNCLWVQPRNPEQLAERIEFLLSDKALRADMSVKNRQLAAGLSAAAVTGEYLAAYERIIDSHQ